MMHDEGLNVLGAIDNAYRTGVKEERERILNILSKKGLELEKDVSWDDEASHTRYVFMMDILELLRGYK